jgi:hypothetical protein
MSLSKETAMIHSRIATALCAAALATGSAALAEGTYPPPGSTAPGAPTAAPPGAGTAPRTSPPASGGSAPAYSTPAPGATQNVDTTPLVIVVPAYFAMDPNLANGCWARLYDQKDFRGTVFAMVGPVNIPHNRAGYITGFEAGRNYDSLQLGSRANLTVWERENYQNKSTTFAPGQAVPNLDSRMGGAEEIKSMKLSCSQ